MKIQIHEGLPFVEVKLIHKNKMITLNRVLVDTGSAGTIFDIDELAHINLIPEPEDPIHTISGVGGSEFVVEKTIDQIKLSSIEVRNFSIEIGAMEYNPDLQGIPGFGFFLKTRAIIDLAQLEIHSGSSQ